MDKLLQNQALTTSLARQNNLSYASLPKCLIFLYFIPSSQNSNDNSGLKGNFTMNYRNLYTEEMFFSIRELTTIQPKCKPNDTYNDFVLAKAKANIHPDAPVNKKYKSLGQSGNPINCFMRF